MAATTAPAPAPPGPAAPAPTAPLAPAPRRRRRLLPYLLLAPGMLWLVVFFLIPILTSVSASVQTGSLDTGYNLTWRWANFSDVFAQYGVEMWHSLVFSLLCTVGCLVLGFPLAYYIAFKGGRWKNLLMALVVAPSFTSFLIRTMAWKTILSDSGTTVRVLNDLGINRRCPSSGLTDGHHVLASPAAVVCGMIYNFLPFTVLPLYTSLEKIDPRLHEAGADLYCSAYARWRWVTWPIALPGVIAGTLLTFIPAVGDYINAQLLGNANTQVIGQVIENELLRDIGGYPVGSAMSVILMAGTLLIVLSYVRKAGTEDLF